MRSCTTGYSSGEEEKKESVRARAAAAAAAIVSSARESRAPSRDRDLAFKEGHRNNETEIKGSKHLLSRSALFLVLYARKITTAQGEQQQQQQQRELLVSQSVATAFTTVFTLDCILKIARCHYATMKKRKEFRLKRRLRTDKNA